jgi:hypothetical protein
MSVNNVRISTVLPEEPIHSPLILGPNVDVDKKILLSAAMEMQQCFPSTLWSSYITFPTAVKRHQRTLVLVQSVRDFCPI